MTLENKTILITGASRGLGRALALAAAQEGMKLVLVARASKDFTDLQSHLDKRGARYWRFERDLSDLRFAQTLVAEAQGLSDSPIDILVNNASTLGPTPLRLLADTKVDDFRRVLELNLLAPFALTRSLASAMVLRGSGWIVNVSSDAAVSAYEEWGAYSASKSALDHMTRVWSGEAQGTGLHFLSLDPSEMDTAMHAAALPTVDPRSLAKPEEVADTLMRYLREHFASGPHKNRLIYSERKLT